MNRHIITLEAIEGFEKHLKSEEHSVATIDKYCHELRAFCAWLCGREVNKEIVAEYKQQIIALGRAPVSVNGTLAALHAFFGYAGWDECRVKYLKLQRQIFRDSSRELTKNEYERLVLAAISKGKTRTALVIETICAVGIRVSELKYITVETLNKGRADVSLKGKIRTILLPNKLCRKLLKYARKCKIASGEIFITRSGKSLSRRQIWAEMKKLCKSAVVDASKVFPHNLRHLFARTFYRVCKDIVRLADVLGHSSIETTRIYLISTGVECKNQLEKLGLVS